MMPFRIYPMSLRQSESRCAVIAHAIEILSKRYDIGDVADYEQV